jgi:hypothetical protein
MTLQHLLNVLVQIANKVGHKKQTFGYTLQVELLEFTNLKGRRREENQKGKKIRETSKERE